MFRRSLIPVWIGIILLSGIFLLGQEAWDQEQCVPAPVEKTGQTVSQATGDDGELQKGVAWPSPRFTDNGNGTVTDKLTELVWLKNASCDGTKMWTAAVSFCNALADGSYELADGSSAGDWRLPNVRELHSLIDYGSYGPALPGGHPFSSAQSSSYWSSSTDAHYASDAWDIDVAIGYVSNRAKTRANYVLCVQGGQ